MDALFQPMNARFRLRKKKKGKKKQPSKAVSL